MAPPIAVSAPIVVPVVPQAQVQSRSPLLSVVPPVYIVLFVFCTLAILSGSFILARLILLQRREVRARAAQKKTLRTLVLPSYDRSPVGIDGQKPLVLPVMLTVRSTRSKQSIFERFFGGIATPATSRPTVVDISPNPVNVNDVPKISLSPDSCELGLDGFTKAQLIADSALPVVRGRLDLQPADEEADHSDSLDTCELPPESLRLPLSLVTRIPYNVPAIVISDCASSEGKAKASFLEIPAPEWKDTADEATGHEIDYDPEPTYRANVYIVTSTPRGHKIKDIKVGAYNNLSNSGSVGLGISLMGGVQA